MPGGGRQFFPFIFSAVVYIVIVWNAFLGKCRFVAQGPLALAPSAEHPAARPWQPARRARPQKAPSFMPHKDGKTKMDYHSIPDPQVHSEQDLWRQFESTGSIQEYLRYRQAKSMAGKESGDAAYGNGVGPQGGQSRRS